MLAVVCKPFGSRRFVALTLALTAGAALVSAQIPGRNVNMVSGDKWPDGDPYLQRQNEPSLAASTRNPLHLLAGANDYRTVDIPGLPTGGETGDAWLGLFKSFDGGTQWKSTLLPGYPQDTSAEGKASPIYGYQAAADPVVRPGPSGLFYYSGIVFDRAEGGKSRVFVSRFIDNNNKEAGDPIHYLGATTVASEPTGSSSFIDKPWIAVDVPRGGAKTCNIETAGSRGGRGTQKILAGNVYTAYAVITGAGADITSTIMFSRSVDCGASWSRPIAISRPNDRVNQGAAIAVDPTTGSVYVAWRKFGLRVDNDAILVARSVNGSSFARPDTLREFATGRSLGQLIRFLMGNRRGRVSEPVADVDPLIAPFDQSSSDTIKDKFRTSAYPTMAIDGQNRVYVAWSERGFRSIPANPNSQVDDDDPADDASIVMSTGVNGTAWTPAFAVDTHGTPGHQFMPSLAFGGGKLMLVYYDLREDISGVFRAFVDENSALFYGSKRHTVDLRAAQADPANIPAFAPSVQVSEYVRGSRPQSKLVEQMQFNPPNLPLFQLGSVPFIGDYVDIAAAPAMVQDASGQWRHNTAATSSPVFHTAWTDNRDVRPPTDKDWTRYTPPSTGQLTSTFDPSQMIAPCEVGRAGMRNQNIYTSRITAGLIAGSPGNAKPLNPDVPRGFVVFAQNATYDAKSFSFTIENQPVGGWASFTQREMDPIVTQVNVLVPPHSTVSRTVFATSTDSRARISVDVTEIASVRVPAPVDGGLRSAIILNPDIANPDIANPDIANPDIANPDIANPDIANPDIANAEVYNPDIANPDIANPDIANPDIANPDIANPDIANVVVMNPDIANPDIANPDIANPDIANPDIANPDIANPDIANGSITDVTWTVTNRGNTTASYDVNLLGGKKIPDGIKGQLIVHKTYKTPVSDGCTLKTQTQTILVANIILNPDIANPDIANPDIANPDIANPDIANPDIANPDIANASLWLEPGGTAKVTLRIVDPNPRDNITFNPLAGDTAVTPEIQAEAINTQQLAEAEPEPPAATPPSSPTTAMIFTAQALGGLVSQTLSPFVVYAQRTQDGATAPAAGLPVTLAILTNPGGGQLSGTTTVVTDASGVAAFPNLTIDRSGAGYQLVATASAASTLPVSTASFNITVPAADPGQNIFFVTTTADSGPGSLRQAIIDANATPNFSPALPDLIAFAFRTSGVNTISVNTPLPPITDAVVIDGSTQSGYNVNTGQPVVQIAGTSFPQGNAAPPAPITFSAGFTLDTTGAVIRGLSITGFGTTPSPTNTIAIRVIGGSATIVGNWIGLAPDGSVAPNQVGIWVAGGAAAIGGTNGLVTRNVISGNRTAIAVNGGSGTLITGNYIGTDPTGTLARSNFIHGISLFGPAMNVTIGGAIPPGGHFDPAWPGNLIAANLQNGIQLLENADGAPTGTRVLGNVIGLNINGDDISAGRHGVLITRAPGTVIGEPGAGNIISGNGQISPLIIGNGITVSPTPTPVLPVPVIQSNWIGVDLTGTAARANAYGGIVLESPATVGGTGAGQGNLIAGNGDATIVPLAGTGVNIRPGAGGTVVQGNIIGLNVNGAALGNGYSGIGAHASALIGGDIVATPLARNVISGNPFTGIAISGDNATIPTNVTVQGNYIGTNAAGLVAGVGNGRHGIWIATGSDHTIGGDTPAEGNVIAGNVTLGGGAGVQVNSPARRVDIRSNVIVANNGLGINLGDNNTVLPNDPGDLDTGANEHQNFPVLTASRNVHNGMGYLRVQLDSQPGTYKIQVFNNAACDPSGHGEGQELLLQTTVTIGAVNPVEEIIETPLLAAGQVLTATATDSQGNTSEFSQCATVTATSAFYWSANGHFYEYVNTPTSSWNAANTAANAKSLLGRPGHLVTIASSAENEFVRSLYGQMSLFDMRAWIGLTDPSGTGNWQWGTGEAFGYTNWDAGEPTGGSERWVEFFAAGVWNDRVESAFDNQGFVVEYHFPL